MICEWHYEWDNAKNHENQQKHKINFTNVKLFEWEQGITFHDVRTQEEVRFISYGMVAQRLHVLIWTKRNAAIRVISFRKANKREMKLYGKQG